MCPLPRTPLRPRGQRRAAPSSARCPAGQRAPRARPPALLLSQRCPPRPRSPRSVSSPLPLFSGGGRGARRGPLPLDPRRCGARILPHLTRDQTHRQAPAAPTPPAGDTRHSPRAAAAARTRPGASRRRGGGLFSGGRSSCTRSGWRCERSPWGGQPRGLVSLRPRRPLRSPRARTLRARGCSEASAAHPPRWPAGGTGPAGKSFISLSPTCALLKANEKLLPLVRFVALRKRRPRRAGPSPARRPSPRPAQATGEGGREFPR